MSGPESEDLRKSLEFSEHRRALLQNRVSKGSIEEDTTLWSYVDLITLLLILFILFYSHALTHTGSEKNISSTQPQISADPSSQVHKASIASKSTASDQNQPEQDAFKTEAENPDESLEQLEQQVLQTVSEKVKNDVSTRWNQKRLVLVLGEKVAFNVGNADLLPDFRPTLKRIAEFISLQKGYKVAIAGHTDDAPINTTQFPSNWELSAIRAVNVAKFMILHGVNPHRISIEGYSAYRPLYPNTTSDNRHANRRVEITLIKEGENEEATEKKAATSALDASMNPQENTNLPAYPNKRYHTVPGYPF